MKFNRLIAEEWVKRIFFALLFTGLGFLILTVFNPWGRGPLLGSIEDYLAKIGTSIFLLGAAFLARRSKSLQKYWHLIFAFFIMIIAISLDLIFGIYVIKQLGISDTTPIGWALPKLNESFVVITVIIIFTLLSGESLGSIYIQKGNFKLGLIIGLIAFFIFAAGSIPMASLFKVKDLSTAGIISLLPSILIYVLANGTLEEVLFRGLFLRKLQPFLGNFVSIFLIAFVFTGLHLWVSYAADQRIFIAVTFPLAIALGYIMQKTDSVIGSILLHAGMDIPIMLGIFSNL